jgi:cytochrome c-type biogenesis protein CcmH
VRALAGATLVAIAFALPAAASNERPTLAELETELMCPTCHTTLDQSSAPVADRMRAFIRARIAAGDTKQEIKDRLVAQFGEQVLASPPRSGFNLLAWVLPPVGVILGAGVLAVLAVRWSRSRARERAELETVTLEPDVERRLDDELARFDA